MNKVFGTGFSRKDLFIPPSPSPQHGNRVYTGEVEGGGFFLSIHLSGRTSKAPFSPVGRGRGRLLWRPINTDAGVLIQPLT